MMKNTEWGAAVYLSHSQYGIGNEINMNNASDFYTGYSAAPNTNQSTATGDSSEHTEGSKTQPWNTPIGYLASTSGNISGIYDMSGGAWEYMAACMEGIPGKDSGFDTQTLESEMANGYIDKYNKNSSYYTYNNRILGDATGEMGPFYSYYEFEGGSYPHGSWYGDNGIFANTSYDSLYDTSWSIRGGAWWSGVLGGQFYFSGHSGEAHNNGSFRLVLAPLN